MTVMDVLVAITVIVVLFASVVLGAVLVKPWIERLGTLYDRYEAWVERVGRKRP